jgi:c-di-GMP-binding flagellar brake protein YcgR
MLQNHGDIEGLFTVGCPAVIHTNPGDRDEKRYPTVVRGWYEGNYVLLDRPLSQEGAVPLTKSQRCLLRFLSEGKACGFPCTLLKTGDTVLPYLRVSWPRKIECVDIRKHERVEVRVPCTISRPDHDAVDGQTVDVSAGGCGIWTETRIAPDTHIQVSFTLPDASVVSNARVTVCSARAVGKGFLLGCRFDEDEEARTTCDFLSRPASSAIVRKKARKAQSCWKVKMSGPTAHGRNSKKKGIV